MTCATADLLSPLDAGTFDALMATFEPWEMRPRLAVGLSGGADSKALTLLARDWLAARDGELVALVVDHGLRPEAAPEAEAVAAWCRRLAINVEVLRWQSTRPVSGIEAAARSARHDLLKRAVERRGILHLLLAHHVDDQAETVAMRRESGSGTRGLAGMSACVEWAGYRVLRPFLGVPRERLVATLKTRHETWVEDPMNRDTRFARARLRSRGNLPAPDCNMATARIRLEDDLAAALPGLLTLDRFGAAALDRRVFRSLPDDLARLVLMSVARLVGGLEHAPRGDRIEAMAGALRSAEPVSRTLGRCHWKGDSTVSVTREARHLPTVTANGGFDPVVWDRRFRVVLPKGTWTVRPFDPAGDREVCGNPSGFASRIERTLPVIDGLEGLVAVPHLDWTTLGANQAIRARFVPPQPLSGPRFTLSYGAGIDRVRTP
ncbi:MAG: tRNA lysidine(34) synthetase TilS [Rhodospirillales bacterium]|nr:tRNA lysidine(34) synthetase TilS [Rhodospirillales bacterium]